MNFTELAAIASISSDLVWVFVTDIVSLSFSLAILLSLIGFVSLIKSLQPRYSFIHKQDDVRKTDSDPSQPSLTYSNIRQVYQTLSWSQTQSHLERVNWLNQTVKSLWPSVETLLNKYVLNDAIKAKGPKAQTSPKKQPKLSIYLSIRRKLDKLRRSKAYALSEQRGCPDRNIMTAIGFIFKLLVVYGKQLVMDYILHLLNKKSNSDREIDIKESIIKSLSDKGVIKRPKSWAGFDLGAGRRVNTWSKLIEKRRKIMSAPSRTRTNRVILSSNSFINADGMARLRQKRLKMMEKMKKKTLKIEEVRLGESIPVIEGIKHIKENNQFNHDIKRANSELLPSDNNNMRFMIELSYKSDRDFYITADHVPIFNHMKLTKLSYRVRLLLTINHSTKEFDKDLEIFASPDIVLFPAINYCQITLVDVPKLDWRLVRFKKFKLTTKPRTKSDKAASSNVVASKIQRLLSPVYLVNHMYFKYLVHLMLYLILKWFQPFDIKIGQYLYLRTIC